MNNSFQLKDRELQLLVLFLLIILEMRSSAALECAACVFFSENCELGEKIRSKFVSPWEMTNLPWGREKGGETVRVERSVNEWNTLDNMIKKSGALNLC